MNISRALSFPCALVLKVDLESTGEQFRKVLELLPNTIAIGHCESISIKKKTNTKF